MLSVDNDIIQRSTLLSASEEVRKLGTHDFPALDKTTTERAFEMHSKSSRRKTKRGFPWVTMFTILSIIPFLAGGGETIKGHVSNAMDFIQSDDFSRVVSEVQSNDVNVSALRDVLPTGMIKK